MLSHCSLGKQHEVLLFGKALLLSGSRRRYFHPPTPSAPHPQPVNFSGCDLKAVHLGSLVTAETIQQSGLVVIAYVQMNSATCDQ